MKKIDKVFTRRAVLGVAGFGSIGVLVSCSSVSLTSAAVEDYSGEVKFNSYEKPAGEFQPATRERRAQNVPRPVNPDNVRDKTTAGLYAALGYFMASYEYFIVTGEPDCLAEADLFGDKAKKAADSFARSVKDSWVAEYKVTLTLKEPAPRLEGDTYIWSVSGKMSFGDFAVGPGGVNDIPANEREKELGEGDWKFNYKDGKWIAVSGQSDSGNGSSSSGGIMNI